MQEQKTYGTVFRPPYECRGREWLQLSSWRSAHGKDADLKVEGLRFRLFRVVRLLAASDDTGLGSC